MATVQIPHEWCPREYQYPLWDFLEKGGTRAVAVWHRRAGKDLFAINWIARCMVTRPGLYWHCFPTYEQGRKIAWDGFTKAGKKFLNAFPEELQASKSNTTMRIELKSMGYNVDGSPQPGGIYQVVGTDDVDRLVGPNPFGVVFSEYSISDPRAWEYIRPILIENGGWALFIYTPRGHNHGYTLLELSRKSTRWFNQVLTVADTISEGIPSVSMEDIETAKLEDGMTEEMVQQEFYCSFEAPLIGAYYGKEMLAMRGHKGVEQRGIEPVPSRIGNVPWEPRLPVHTYWDIGMDDATAIIMMQVFGQELRIIDYLEDSGEGLPYYIKALRDKPYVFDRHYGPHDIEVRDFSNGKSRKEVAYSLGVRFIVTPKMDLMDGIGAVRDILHRVWIDEAKCLRLINALCSYRKKWNEERKVYENQPLHDWSSHGADAMRTMAVNHRDVKKRDKKERLQTTGFSDYDPLNRYSNTYESVD